MRKNLTRLLSLALCCLLGSGMAKTAMAAEESAAPDTAVSLNGVNSLFTANGSLYANCWGGLYRLDGQAENPVPIAVDEELLSFQKITACQDAFYAVGAMDNQSVLYSLTLSGSALGAARELATFPAPEGENAYCDCTALVADESAVWVLLSVSDMTSLYNTTALYRVDRASGATVALDVKNLTDLCAYREGFLLARQWDGQAAQRSYEGIAPEMVCIDKATLSVMALCTLPDDSFSAPAYDAAADCIYLVSPSRLIRLDGGFAEETCAYLALRYVSDGAPAILWNERYLLAASYDEPRGFVSFATDPALMPRRVLKLAQTDMDDMTRAFCGAHPEIAVTLKDSAFYSTKEIAQGMAAASDEIDVFSLYLGHGSFGQLVKKGYCANLSGSEILTRAVGRMAPALTADCYNADGELMALPYRANADGVGYSPSALKKLGLTEADLPRTYLELMDFSVRWVDEYADNEDGLTLFDSIYDIRWQLMQLSENAYISGAKARGEALSFDTPLYRSLLAKLDEVTPSILELNPEEGNDGTGSFVVFYEDNQEAPSLFTLYASITPRAYRSFDYVPLTPTLEAGDDPIFDATVQVLFINPYSQNIDAALTYLEYAAEHIDPYNAIALFPDQNDPIEDSYYQRDAAGSDESIADLRARLLTVDDANRSALEEELAVELDWREQLETRRWSVSAEQIAAYRQLAPYVVLIADSFFANANAADLRARYSAGTLPADQYVSELERILRLIRLENE